MKKISEEGPQYGNKICGDSKKIGKNNSKKIKYRTVTNTLNHIQYI